jgi:glutathione S-transferase
VLARAKSDATIYHLLLTAKPDWYASKISALGKVPAITYGGPRVAPESAAPESIKLTESTILLEFIADLYPTSTHHPATPVDRAKVRYFIDTVGNTIAPAFMGFLRMGKPAQGIYDAAVKIYDLLEDGASMRWGRSLRWRIARLRRSWRAWR